MEVPLARTDLGCEYATLPAHTSPYPLMNNNYNCVSIEATGQDTTGLSSLYSISSSGPRIRRVAWERQRKYLWVIQPPLQN